MRLKKWDAFGVCLALWLCWAWLIFALDENIRNFVYCIFASWFVGNMIGKFHIYLEYGRDDTTEALLHDMNEFNRFLVKKTCTLIDENTTLRERIERLEGENKNVD